MITDDDNEENEYEIADKAVRAENGMNENAFDEIEQRTSSARGLVCCILVAEYLMLWYEVTRLRKKGKSYSDMRIAANTLSIATSARFEYEEHGRPPSRARPQKEYGKYGISVAKAHVVTKDPLCVTYEIRVFSAVKVPLGLYRVMVEPAQANVSTEMVK